MCLPVEWPEQGAKVNFAFREEALGADIVKSEGRVMRSSLGPILIGWDELMILSSSLGRSN